MRSSVEPLLQKVADMKYVILLLLTIELVPLQARKLAIVVGVGAYPEASGLKPLNADYDTKSLADALENTGWQVCLINCQTIQKPDLNTILNSIGLAKDSLNGYSMIPFSGILTGLKPSDEVLFFFGGHGVTNFEGAHCLIPMDASFNNGKCKNSYRLFSIEWVKRSLTRNGAVVMVFIDACRNDMATVRGTEDGHSISTPTFTRTAKVIDTPVMATSNGSDNNERRLALVLSTRPGSFAHEMQQVKAGVFTNFFIQLLKNPEAQEEADNQPSDGLVTLKEAAMYLKEQTVNFVRSLSPNAKNGDQVPELDIKDLETHPFVEVEAKRLSDPKYMLKYNELRQKRNLQEFGKPGFGHPFEYIPSFFQVEKGNSYDAEDKVLTFKNARDKYAISEMGFDHRFLATQDWAAPDEYFMGLKPFEFYCPTEIIQKVMSGRHKLSIDALRFQAANDAIIKGYCLYKLEESVGLYPIVFKGREKQVKVWKITQELYASNDDPCHPLKVRGYRIYHVLKNLAAPVILEMESHFCYYVEKERVNPELKYCRSTLKEEVDYLHRQVEEIFIKN